MLGPNSSLRVYRSDDHGGSWTLLAVIPAVEGRDLRDPCFYVDATGALAIKAITRLPVNSTRDSDVDSITMRTTSTDGGTTWSALAPIGPEVRLDGPVVRIRRPRVRRRARARLPGDDRSRPAVTRHI